MVEAASVLPQMLLADQNVFLGIGDPMDKWILISFFGILFCAGCGNSDRREIGQTELTTSEPTKYHAPSAGIDLYERAQIDPHFGSDNPEYNQQRDSARRDILNAQDDLNSAVRKLNDGDWDNDLGRVKRRLNDLEDANDRYSAAGGNSNLGPDIDRMRSQLRRLESDDWREVVPDIQRTNRSIDFESNSLRND